MVKPDEGFTSKEVIDFHKKSDVDASAKAQHHTLGPDPNQSSPGAHTHDGISSKLIGTGITITGSRSGGAALVSVIAALKKLGMTDSTTA